MTSAEVMRCSQCQAELPGDTKFCGQCGTPIKHLAPRAELRQLSVMFCDLVGSTAIADALDPEDLRDITGEYHAVCSRVIESFGGHIAQYLGDGLLVYFGYPLAHEDDARRAAQAALAILDSIAKLATRIEAQRQVKLAVRVGVHTGPVVVGEVGEGPQRENWALGRTPNIAARVESFARPGTALISDDTFRIVQGYFDCEPLGAHALKGLAEPVEMHRLLGISGAT
jgi:class 3 adenylate cyclase